MVEQVTQERRRDFHRQVLIDVAVRLQKHFGTDYARQYLADVNIPELTIARVLWSPQLRQATPTGAYPPGLPRNLAGIDRPPVDRNDH